MLNHFKALADSCFSEVNKITQYDLSAIKKIGDQTALLGTVLRKLEVYCELVKCEKKIDAFDASRIGVGVSSKEIDNQLMKIDLERDRQDRITRNALLVVRREVNQKGTWVLQENALEKVRESLHVLDTISNELDRLSGKEMPSPQASREVSVGFAPSPILNCTASNSEQIQWLNLKGALTQVVANISSTDTGQELEQIAAQWKQFLIQSNQKQLFCSDNDWAKIQNIIIDKLQKVKPGRYSDAQCQYLFDRAFYSSFVYADIHKRRQQNNWAPSNMQEYESYVQQIIKMRSQRSLSQESCVAAQEKSESPEQMMKQKKEEENEKRKQQVTERLYWDLMCTGLEIMEGVKVVPKWYEFFAIQFLQKLSKESPEPDMSKRFESVIVALYSDPRLGLKQKYEKNPTQALDYFVTMSKKGRLLADYSEDELKTMVSQATPGAIKQCRLKAIHSWAEQRLENNQVEPMIYGSCATKESRQEWVKGEVKATFPVAWVFSTMTWWPRDQSIPPEITQNATEILTKLLDRSLKQKIVPTIIPVAD